MGFLSWQGGFKKEGNHFERWVEKMHYNTDGFKVERIEHAIHVNTNNDEC